MFRLLEAFCKVLEIFYVIFAIGNIIKVVISLALGALAAFGLMALGVPVWLSIAGGIIVVVIIGRILYYYV